MLNELKENLKITWDDEDNNLNRSIEAGKEYLQNIAGTTLDFESSSFNKTLLFEYCRYDYNNALEYFDENFKNQIVHLQVMNVVDKDVK